MKNSEYKIFKHIVINANDQSEIWWCGADWMDLTDKQLQDIKAVLNYKRSDGVITIETDAKGDWYMMPSGLKIKKEG